MGLDWRAFGRGSRRFDRYSACGPFQEGNNEMNLG